MKKIMICLATVLLCCSIIIALYPTICRYLAQIDSNKSANNFDESIENIQNGSYEEALKNGIIDKSGHLKNADFELPVLFKEDLNRLYIDSLEYNASIVNNQNFKKSSDFRYPSLNLSSYGIHNGMYGYMTIESIDLILPIYLGANEHNMSIGASHLNTTSLPTGGKGTNCVLAGHTGYTGKTLFDNIHYLNIGDEITIKNYFTTLKYKVYQKKNIQNNNLADIYADENKDLLTLLTCSNGGATRLLVICERKEDNKW